MPDATSPAACRQCGGPVVRKSRGPAPTYCSARCKATAKYQRDKSSGKYLAQLEQHRAQRTAEQQANARPCPFCGGPMTNPRRVQCGAPECKRKLINERQREWQREHKQKTGQRYNTRFASQAPQPRYPKTCDHCAKPWTAWNIDALYCSHECWVRSRTPPLALRVQAPWWARRPLPEPGKQQRRRWYCGRCIRCDEWFIHDQPATRYCSKGCSRADHRARRRALKRDAYVSTVYRIRIFKRDRWTCRLCGERVVRTAVVPHPKAPVLDHIVPLARGGTHEPANVQCAHFLCNSLKGDRGGGEQLMLVG